MPDEPSILFRLVQALNEDDADARATMLARTWAPDARMTIDGDLVAIGRDEMDVVIARWLEDPKAWIALSHEQPRPNGLAARWRTTGAHVRPATFRLHATIADGHIAELSANRTEDVPPRPNPLSRFGDVLLSNPIATAGLLGGAFYLALRVPVGLFYSLLGVQPDEVGFGPEVLVPQSLTLVVTFLLAAATAFALAWIIWPVASLQFTAEAYDLGDDDRSVRQAYRRSIAMAIALTIVLGGLVVWLLRNVPAVAPLTGFFGIGAVLIAVVAARGTLWLSARRNASVARWKRRTSQRMRRRIDVRTLALAMITAVTVYGAMLLLALPFMAVMNARDVRDGGVQDGRVTPWRAQPVSVRWLKNEHVALTNDCAVLRLLGTGSGQVVLYDSKLDKVFRIPIADVTTAVDPNCA